MYFNQEQVFVDLCEEYRSEGAFVIQNDTDIAEFGVEYRIEVKSLIDSTIQAPPDFLTLQDEVFIPYGFDSCLGKNYKNYYVYNNNDLSFVVQTIESSFIMKSSLILPETIFTKSVKTQNHMRNYDLLKDFDLRIQETCAYMKMSKPLNNSPNNSASNKIVFLNI